MVIKAKNSVISRPLQLLVTDGFKGIIEERTILPRATSSVKGQLTYGYGCKYYSPRYNFSPLKSRIPLMVSKAIRPFLIWQQMCASPKNKSLDA
jgi:hypothetical protein